MGLAVGDSRHGTVCSFIFVFNDISRPNAWLQENLKILAQDMKRSDVKVLLKVVQSFHSTFSILHGSSDKCVAGACHTRHHILFLKLNL